MITITEFSVHESEESPVFGETVVKVSLANEGVGNYIVIRDLNIDSNNEVRLDFKQLHEIVEQIKLLGWE